MSKSDQEHFESDVARLCRILWDRPYDGAEMIDSRERDGVYRTDDIVHFVEATCSRKKEKIENDYNKILGLFKSQRRANPGKVFKGWLVTSEEPTAEQRSVVETTYRDTICVVSYDALKRRLIDVHKYLERRDNAPFGSTRNLIDGSYKLSRDAYVDHQLQCSSDKKSYSISDLAERMLEGGTFLLSGDYGIGKSMTLRQVYFELSRRYREGLTRQFPVYLNLRDHAGQSEPDEILYRHAQSIGFDSNGLIGAWRAGYCILLIDGYDEIGVSGTASAFTRLKEVRYRSLQGLRKLINQTDVHVGAAIAGRTNYFDSESERETALGNRKWKTIELDEMEESQLQELAKKNGYNHDIPSWLPGKPLLLLVLIATARNSDIVLEKLLDDPAAGWEILINKIVEREALIEHGFHPEAIRTFLERLATIARTSDSDYLEVSQEDIVTAFSDIFGYVAKGEELAALARLPGLISIEDRADKRRFIDREYCDVLSARESCNLVVNPYDTNTWKHMSKVQHSLGDIGGRVLLSMLTDVKCYDRGHIMAVVSQANQIGASGAALHDFVNILIQGGFEPTFSIEVNSAIIDRISFVGVHAQQRVTYNECMVRSLEIGNSAEAIDYPRMVGCYIIAIEDRTGIDDLPSDMFTNCIIDSYLYNDMSNVSQSDSKMSAGRKILIDVLRKLFVQSQSGRRESALYRGITSNQIGVVDQVLQLLRQNEVASLVKVAGESIWLPNRRMSKRVRSLIDRPIESTDDMAKRADSFSAE